MHHDPLLRLVRLLLGALVALVALSLPAAATTAGDEPSTPSTQTSTTEAPQTGEIIPKPNSGVAPTDAGDRGGALQTGLFVLVIAATGGIAVYLWRQSKKAREARGF